MSTNRTIDSTRSLRRAQLLARADEIFAMIERLRRISSVRGEKSLGSASACSPYLAMAQRLDHRVDLLLGVDWELQRGKEMIDAYEHSAGLEGRQAGLHGLGDLPKGPVRGRDHDGQGQGR